MAERTLLPYPTTRLSVIAPSDLISRRSFASLSLGHKLCMSWSRVLRVGLCVTYHIATENLQRFKIFVVNLIL